MPNHWVIMQGSPGPARRKEVKDVISQFQGVSLVGDQIYFSDDEHTAYALIRVPDGFDATDLLHRLRHKDHLPLLDADEKGKKPVPGRIQPS
jgi:hypothetical protein